MNPRSLLRAGSVPYLNAAPLIRGLEGRVRLLPPSQLAIALQEGEIDAALLSITEALFSRDYDILDGPCVASNGAVFSVFLAHRLPLEQAERIAYDPASLASLNLLRVLLGERGVRPEFVALEDPGAAGNHDFVLLIGNPAIEFRRARPAHSIWDLGSAWRELTGLPFVFAVWALRQNADTGPLRAQLLAAADRGQRELADIIRTERDFDEAFRRTYLTRHIHHRLGPAERRGIERFATLLRCHNDRPVFEPRYVSG